MSEPSNANTTRERLLAAAMQVFAERGYEAATIREICSRADANVAAVHYHFGDKRSLYEAIFSSLFATLRARRRAFLPPEAPPEERLRGYLRVLFEEIFVADGDAERRVQLSTIYLAEMARPTEALDRIVAAHMEPDARELYGIVADLLGISPEDPLTVDCAASIIGQVLYYYQAEPIISRLHANRPPVSARIDELIEHVWLFSLGGLERAARARAVRATSGSDEPADQGC